MSDELRRWLEDGAEIVVRSIRPEDKQGLREGVERLGLQSRYRRFFSAMPSLSSAQLRYLTEVDHHSHEALLAIDPHTGQGIAVARFIRSDEDPAVAEVAVAVSDPWQRRGVGTLLLNRLAVRAREEGVERFSASVLAENRAMLEMVQKLGGTQASTHDEVIDLLMDLPEQGLPQSLSNAVRAAARGEIRSAERPAALQPGAKRQVQHE